jgi:nuclear cap-binding protein subunit 1
VEGCADGGGRFEGITESARRRMSASWHSLLVRIGERCQEYGGHADAEDHVETCFSYLARDLPHSGSEILALLMQCVEELPHKDPLYGALVGLINTEDTEFVAKVVAQTHAGIQEALDTDNCNKLRILTRFLTVLMCSGVVAPSSLIELYEALVSSAATTVDEENGNPEWQSRADFYVFCILASLPWGGMELAERVPEELDRVLNGVEAYLNLRKPLTYSSLQVFEPVDDKDINKCEDYLKDLWSRVQGLMAGGWKVDSVPRPHLVFEARLATMQSHDFGPVSVPETPKPPPDANAISLGRQRQEAQRMYPRRLVRLHIFPAAKTDEKMTPIDRFVAELICSLSSTCRRMNR